MMPSECVSFSYNATEDNVTQNLDDLCSAAQLRDKNFCNTTLNTVKPRCLAPHYLAKLAAHHVNVKDGFPAMYFTSISRHPRLSPSPRPGWVSPGVIWPRYVATVGPAAAVPAHKVSVLADQRPWPVANDSQIINLVSTSSQASPAGSDEGEEDEEDSDGMLQYERVSPSVAVGAIDTLMHYFEQCQLTTLNDIEHLSAIKCRVNYTRLATQKQSSIRDYFKPWHDQLTKTKTAVNLL